MYLSTEGVQNTPPHDVPLWQVNYVERKAIKTLRALGKFYLSLKEFKFGGLSKFIH